MLRDSVVLVSPVEQFCRQAARLERCKQERVGGTEAADPDPSVVWGVLSPSFCACRKWLMPYVLQRDTNTRTRAGNILYTAVSQSLAGGSLESDFPDNNYIFKKRITETREDGLVPTRQEHEL